MKYQQEGILYQRNTHEKKIWTHKIPKRKKLQTHKTPRRKEFGPTK